MAQASCSADCVHNRRWTSWAGSPVGRGHATYSREITHILLSRNHIWVCTWEPGLSSAPTGHLFTACHGVQKFNKGFVHYSSSRLGVLIYACNCYLSSLQGDQHNYARIYFGMLCNDGSGDQEFNTAINNRCEYWLTQPPKHCLLPIYPNALM